jgi:hypothetical protein
VPNIIYVPLAVPHISEGGEISMLSFGFAITKDINFPGYEVVAIGS